MPSSSDDGAFGAEDGGLARAGLVVGAGVTWGGRIEGGDDAAVELRFDESPPENARECVGASGALSRSLSASK